MSGDVHTFTGAYVLDALSDEERRAFEEHMTQCSACSQEVAELRETTARLGGAAAAPVPPGLWAKVHDGIGRTRQLPPVPDVSPVPVVRRWPVRVAVLTAAAAVIAAVTVGVVATDRNSELTGRLTQAQGELDKIRSVLGAPDARVEQQAVGGSTVTVILSRSADGMVVMVQGLPVLQPTQSFQAWLVDRDGRQTSAGVMDGQSATMLAEHITDGRVQSLAVTVEPRGGSPAPTGDFLLTMPLPA